MRCVLVGLKVEIAGQIAMKVSGVEFLNKFYKGLGLGSSWSQTDRQMSTSHVAFL